MQVSVKSKGLASVDSLREYVERKVNLSTQSESTPMR